MLNNLNISPPELPVFGNLLLIDNWPHVFDFNFVQCTFEIASKSLFLMIKFLKDEVKDHLRFASLQGQTGLVGKWRGIRCVLVLAEQKDS